MDLPSCGLVELGEVKAFVDWSLRLNEEYVSAINFDLWKAFQELADGATLVHPKFCDALKLPVRKEGFLKRYVAVPENLVSKACA
jgi:hypothetical protein